MVGQCVSLATAKGNTWALPEGTDEARLEAQLFPAKTPPERFAEPGHFQVHQELKTKGMTLQLLTLSIPVWTTVQFVSFFAIYRSVCSRLTVNILQKRLNLSVGKFRSIRLNVRFATEATHLPQPNKSGRSSQGFAPKPSSLKRTRSVGQ